MFSLWKAVNDNEENATEEQLGLTGWICPVCGAGISPYITRCPCTQEYVIDWPKTFGDVKITWK